MHYWAECQDIGRILLTPYPPKPRQRGCLWLKKRINIYEAFTTVFQFEIKGSDLDVVHGGGDGLALVFQNHGPVFACVCVCSVCSVYVCVWCVYV